MCRMPCRKVTASRPCSRSALPDRQHIVSLVPRSEKGSSGASGNAPTSVSLFDQGLVQVLQASVTGLEPKKPYVLAFANNR